MAIKLKVENLRDAVNKLISVVDKKSSRAILSNFVFEYQKDSLKILATDLEVAAQIKLPASSDDVGEFCINSKNISEILRELPDSDLFLEVNKEKNSINLKCELVEYKLITTSSEEFPKIKFSFSSNNFQLSAKQITQMISKTAFAMSTDETRIFLNGIFLQKNETGLRTVAIDGHRLALVDQDSFDYPHKILIDGIIIPKKGVYELKKIAEAQNDGKINFSIDESFIYATTENYTLSVRLISRDYPKYQSVIPAKTNYKMKAEKSDVLNAVKRIKILSNEQTNGVKLSLVKNQLRLDAQNSSLGQAHELLNVDYNGENIEIGFNGKYLIEVLNILEDGEIVFEFTNSLSPVVIKSEKMPNFLSIIMPLRI